MKKKLILDDPHTGRLLFKLSTPAIVAMLISAIYNMVDSYFIGKIGTANATAALGIAFPIFLLLTAVGQVFGVGAGVTVSKFLGEKKYKEANEVASTSVLLSIITSLAITIFGLLFIDVIVGFLKASPETIAHTKSYLTYVFIGATFTILNMNLNNLVRAEGGAFFSMVGISIGAIVNVILDPIFIFNLDLGVAGASIATAIAQGISTIFLLTFYLKKNIHIHLSPKNIRLKKGYTKSIINLGMPSFMRQAFVCISLWMVNDASAAYGDEGLAAISIVFRVTALGIFFNFGLAQGLQPIVAFNYGTKNWRTLKQAINYTLFASIAFCVIQSVLFINYSTGIIRVFNQDPQVIAMGSKYLKIVIVIFFTVGVHAIITTVLQAIGQAKKAFFLATTRQGLFFIPLLLMLPLLIDSFYVTAYSQMIADFLSFLLATIFYLSFLKSIKHLDVKVA